MFDVDISVKRDAVVKYFKDRQGLDAFKVEGTNDMFGMKLLQWQNTDKIYRIKPTKDLARSLKFTKADLEKADAVLFLLETFVWREAYAVKCEELEQHLDADGNGEIDIDKIPCCNYFFFGMAKATQWLIRKEEI